jgi:hypothetical protein
MENILLDERGMSFPSLAPGQVVPLKKQNQSETKNKQTNMG